jgi:hypothetical protein
MASLRNNRSFFEAEIVCDLNDEAVCPKKAGKCDLFNKMLAEDFRGIDPMLMEAGIQFGVTIPSQVIAA